MTTQPTAEQLEHAAQYLHHCDEKCEVAATFLRSQAALLREREGGGKKEWPEPLYMPNDWQRGLEEIEKLFYSSNDVLRAEMVGYVARRLCDAEARVRYLQHRSDLATGAAQNAARELPAFPEVPRQAPLVAQDERGGIHAVPSAPPAAGKNSLPLSEAETDNAAWLEENEKHDRQVAALSTATAQLAQVTAQLAEVTREKEAARNRADAYNEKFQRQCEEADKYMNDAFQLRHQLTAAESKLAEGQRDAERYRWLRDVGSKTFYPFQERWRKSAADCDAAIDREMLKEAAS